MELNNESKTLFIPLYGKAMMSKITYLSMIQKQKK